VPPRLRPPAGVEAVHAPQVARQHVLGQPGGAEIVGGRLAQVLLARLDEQRRSVEVRIGVPGGRQRGPMRPARRPKRCRRSPASCGPRTPTARSRACATGPS
jgi:hypothetical protein